VIKEYWPPDAPHSNWEGLRISAYEQPHVIGTLRSVGFRFEADGKTIAYSGDCRDSPRLLLVLARADIAVVEAATSLSEFRDHGPSPHHLSPEQCGHWARKAKVGHLVLTHLYDTDPPEAVTAAVRKHYAGSLTLAYDGLVLEI
jgi:ribonuclease BN (tRNA processing enzyme)